MRNVTEILRAQPASDGAGVRLLRVFGGPGPERFDPFLMLDEFGSQEASDYIAGFPPHPHRGFETVTYMLQGKMEHRDHMENVGLLNDGDVQWMTAARGIIHSEMPKQTEGRMRGFQLWLNLPADQKMSPATYKDVPAADIPVYEVGAVKVKAIAGTATLNGQALSGHIQKPVTEPVLLDIHLPVEESVSVKLADKANALLYVYEGSAQVGKVTVKSQHLARLSDKGDVVFRALAEDTRVLLIAGQPLKEPIVQYGPFVMNTMEQIEQALTDYRAGTLTGEV